ncbi:TetR/AcrR family transcriptional regulator [Plantibacter sp. YIM 135347]|uniref:TetR/AcrR family transcriptional regulator n=1 Tax=Plantibacter sp. YIM 135347 TaxID=3423919 RepID=UPI003D326915
MTPSPRANRGPGAASQNRAALISAAREVFAAQGLAAPLNAVAKVAGVGQGSLYRHFPTRLSLAIAVFQQNLDDLEALANEPSSTLEDVLGLVTEQAIVSTALFELVADGRNGQGEGDGDDEPDPGETGEADDLTPRITGILAAKLPEAQTAGRVPAWVTVDEVGLGIMMLASTLARTPHAQRRETAASIWKLLPFGV